MIGMTIARGCRDSELPSRELFCEYASDARRLLWLPHPRSNQPDGISKARLVVLYQLLGYRARFDAILPHPVPRLVHLLGRSSEQTTRYRCSFGRLPLIRLH